MVVKNKARIYSGPDEIPSPEYREMLLKLMSVQISSEYQKIGSGYLEFPGPAEASEMGEVLQDESEHGQGLVWMLMDLGVDPSDVIAKARDLSEDAKLLDVFRIPIDCWWQGGVRRWHTERIGGFQSIASLGSSYLPWAVWSARNFEDEGLEHAESGFAIVREAVEAGLKDEVEEFWHTFYSSALDMFGGRGTPNEQKYLELGIKTRSNQELREVFINYQMKEGASIGLTLPADPYQGVRGHYG